MNLSLLSTLQSGDCTDWAALTPTILENRLGPLFHQRFGTDGPLPPDSAESFRRAYLTTAWHNQARLDELGRILESLHAAAIPVTLLKGMALIHTHYDKIALRPMTDIDPLVRPEHLPAAQAILEALGYERTASFTNDTPFLSEVGLQKLGGQLIDLHTALFMPHDLSPAGMVWFFDHQDPLSACGPNVWVLNPTALLLHLCGHLWVKSGANLINWYDIYLVLQKDAARINWDELLARAVEFDLLMPLQHTLPALAAELGAPVPPAVLARLERLQPSQRERRKFRVNQGSAENYVDTVASSILAYPDWRTRLRFARLLFFPDPAYILQRCGRRSPLWLPWLYFYRLAARAVQQLKMLALGGSGR
jgi:hypothetical protein